MQSRNLLSIIIPCYNSDRFISHTLDMLIAQGLQDCEVIVVNDGSTDGTSKIAHAYAEKIASLKVIDKENEGVSVARNVGLESAKGDYIYFLDSDDTLTDGTLDFFRKTLSSQAGIPFFAFGYKSVRNGKTVKTYSSPQFDAAVLEDAVLAKNFLKKKFFANICSCIYERKFLREHDIRFTEGLKIGEDLEFLLKVMQASETAFYSARICFVYQLRDDSTMRGYKVFSQEHLRSFQVRKDLCLSDFYQSDDLFLYANFFLKNEYLSHLLRYLKSDCCDTAITNEFICDKKLLRRPMACGSMKNMLAILIARLLPMKLILKIAKRGK